MRNLVNIGKMSSSASGNETNNIKIDELNQSGVIILQVQFTSIDFCNKNLQ